ncbi:glucose dehydrogenase [FAD, quinone] [Anabrus simplex]|uniref:glucose dehydrogenase [FAD, quinone] n=1 Tax=Anabrus simplex TaxID=316456 RepID=UPI0035A26451
MVHKGALVYLVRRITLAITLTAFAFNFLQLTIRIVRPEIIKNRAKDLTSLGRKIRPHYDFIVVGAGSTGSVIARRLSEVKAWNILLVEAGREEPLSSDVPMAFRSLQDAPVSWVRYAEPNPHYCQAFKGGKCRVATGRVLGGTSTTNGMSYSRGNRRDYDSWAELGNTGWEYHKVLKYFKKSEDMRIKDLQDDELFHATGGCLTIEDMRSRTPLADVLLHAGKELGYDIIDHNGHTQHGFSKMYSTLRDGLRCSAAKAFLEPVKDHKNLDISLNSEVERIIIDPQTKHAKGVIFTKNGHKYTVYADKEVIVSAGAINSPKLLMLSGIGPRKHLEDIGISPIISDLKVGYNLQDHIAIGGIVYLVNPGKGMVFHRDISMDSYLRFSTNFEGPMMRTGFEETVAYVNSKYSDDEEWPDIGLYFSSIPENTEAINALELSNDVYNAVYEPILYRDAYESLGVLLRPRSCGVVKLKGKDPHLPPAIYPNYMSDVHDIKILIEAAKYGLIISQTHTMQEVGATLNPNPFPACADLPMMSDEYLHCAAKQQTHSLCHYVGTCKMGPHSDQDAVVDPRLRVYGVKCLRVADASIMPEIPSGDINAVAIMIGEKVSDMIKEDWVLGKKKKKKCHGCKVCRHIFRRMRTPNETIAVV